MCDYPDPHFYTQSTTLCGPQKAHLSVAFTDPNATAFWYENENDELPVFEGENFVTNDIVTQDRSFWLRTAMITPNTSVQIGEGTLTTSTSGNTLYHLYGGYKHQYIFTAKELKDAGLAAGPITALKFDVAIVGTSTRNNFSIAMGTTTQSTATTTHIDNSNLTQVYSNTSETFVLGVKTFTLNTPYVWDGVSNIILQTNWSNQNSGGDSGSFVYHKTAVAMTTATYGDNKTAIEILETNSGPVISGNTSSGNTVTSVDRPNTVFVGNGECISPAIEIPVVVGPKPALELSTNKVTSCEGDITEAVTVTTNLGGYDTFIWVPSIGVSGDYINGWKFTTSNDQVYTLTASQSNGICQDIKTVKVLVATRPEANPNLAKLQETCKNEIVKLDVLETLPASVTIGNATTTTGANDNLSAFVQSAKYSKQQYIYSASELIAQGVNAAGYINGLTFNTINSGASMTNKNYMIRMMLSSNTSFVNDDFYTGNFTTVYLAETHIHTFQGIQSFTFDNPFYWDGKSNIIVEITHEGIGTGNNNAQTYYTAVPGNNVGISAISEVDADPVSGTRTVNRLNVDFDFVQARVTWSPITNLFVDSAGTVPYSQGQSALTVYTMSSTAGSYIYNALLTSPIGCSTAEAYTIKISDPGTPVVANQTFCKAIPVTDVVVTGHQGGILSFYDSPASTKEITNILTSGRYYVESVQDNCKSIRVPFDVAIITVSLPTAQFTQVICGGGTIGDLVAKGSNGAQIKWYSSNTSTTVLSNSHTLINNTMYYVAQEFSGCESGRIAVLVNINPIPAALSSQGISVCGGLDYGSVNLNQIVGSELVWYQSPTSKQPISNTAQIASGTLCITKS